MPGFHDDKCVYLPACNINLHEMRGHPYSIHTFLVLLWNFSKQTLSITALCIFRGTFPSTVHSRTILFMTLLLLHPDAVSQQNLNILYTLSFIMLGMVGNI